MQAKIAFDIAPRLDPVNPKDLVCQEPLVPDVSEPVLQPREYFPNHMLGQKNC